MSKGNTVEASIASVSNCPPIIS